MMAEMDRRLGQQRAFAAPPGMALERSPGLAQLRIETWEAYHNSPAALESLLKRMDDHHNISVVSVQGKLGAFEAKDSKSLEAVYELYATIRGMKTPWVAFLDELAAPGLCGFWGKRAVASSQAVVPPMLDKTVRQEVPRLVDGGVGFALSRAGAYGRCAALAGLPLRGRCLHGLGLVGAVLSPVAFRDVRDEVTHLAEAGDSKFLPKTIDSLLEMRRVVSETWVEDDRELRDLAALCFEPKSVPGILRLLGAADHPLAGHARDTILQFPDYARLLLAFLDKCADLSFPACRRLEAALNSNLDAHPLETKPLENVEAYFRLAPKQAPER